MIHRVMLLGATAIVTASTSSLLAQTMTGWLDRPMSSWNEQANVPVAPSGGEAQAALERRCGSAAVATSPVGQTLRSAGWVAYQHLDRAITRDDVQVVGGMSAAGPGCDPTMFHLFAFVGGRLAGTMSPVVMTPNKDGEAGAVRVTGTDALTAEFARYKPGDAECCPSSRVRVTYRIERGGARPLLVATDARQVR